LILILLAIYILNYFTGKNANSKIAAYWVQENKEIFDNDFSHVGVTAEKDGKLIDVDSPNCFKFYATGRVNTAYALTTIELKRR